MNSAGIWGTNMYKFHCDMKLYSQEECAVSLVDYQSMSLPGGVDRAVYSMMVELRELCEELKARQCFNIFNPRSMSLRVTLTAKNVLTQCLEVETSDHFSMVVHRDRLDVDQLVESLLPVLYGVRGWARAQITDKTMRGGRRAA